MSRVNLGSKQTIILHNCLIENESYDLVSHRTNKQYGYIKKTKTKKDKNDNKKVIERRIS